MAGQKTCKLFWLIRPTCLQKKNGPDNDADIYAGLYNVASSMAVLIYKSFKGHNGEIKA